MPDPCDYCDCDDVDQGTHSLTCPNREPEVDLDSPPPDKELHRVEWEIWHDMQGYDFCERCDDYGHIAEDCPVN